LLHAALNLGLRLVGVDWIEMRHGSPGAPSEFFSDIVRAPFGFEINFVRAGIGLHAANYFLAGRNHERMVAAGADTHRVFTAGYRGQDQGRRIAVRPIHVNYRVARRRRDFFKRLALHGASECRRRDDAKQEQQKPTVH
jgi:hypothetical protein